MSQSKTKKLLFKPVLFIQPERIELRRYSKGDDIPDGMRVGDDYIVRNPPVFLVKRVKIAREKK